MARRKGSKVRPAAGNLLATEPLAMSGEVLSDLHFLLRSRGALSLFRFCVELGDDIVEAGLGAATDGLGSADVLGVRRWSTDLDGLDSGDADGLRSKAFGG